GGLCILPLELARIGLGRKLAELLLQVRLGLAGGKIVVMQRRAKRLQRRLIPAAAKAPEEAPALVRARPAADRHVGVRGLPNPTLAVRARRTELAHEHALAGAGQVGLDAVALENGATADVARHLVVRRPKLLLHAA